MVEVFATRLLPDAQFATVRDQLLTRVPARIREKVLAFVRTADAQRSLFGELMIRRLLCERLGMRNRDLHMEYGAKGKPFVPGSPVHFNLSHSGDWVVAALSLQPVGIDIEQIKPNKLSVARRFFTDQEVESIMKLPEEQRVDYFFTLWTLKESYLKTVGKGLTLSLASFNVKSVKGRYVIEINGTFADVNLSILSIEKGYRLAVCAFEPITSDTVAYISPADYPGSMESI